MFPVGERSDQRLTSAALSCGTARMFWYANSSIMKGSSCSFSHHGLPGAHRTGTGRVRTVPRHNSTPARPKHNPITAATAVLRAT